MHTPDISRFARHSISRRLAAGVLATQAALFAFGQEKPADPAATEKKKDDDTVVLDTFTVTAGFAGSLAAATEAKQNSKTIVEVIMSEDIGKLPDISIADALARQPGLTTQRVNGRSQGITIRGLRPDFSVGLLNGREQVSTAENRGVEFDQYPSELLNGVIVYKTATPSLTGQGISGSIDLRTARPLNSSGRMAVANAYYDWNDYGQLTPGTKSTGYRVNLAYVDQSADGTMGVAIGLHHSIKPFAGKQFQAWGYPTDSAGNYALGGTKSYVRNNTLDRDGLMAVLEYKPSKNIHSVVDIYAAKFEEKQLLRGMEIPLAFWSSANLQAGYTTSNNLVTNATLTNVQPIVRNDIFKRNDKPISLGWNLVLGEQGAWPLTFDAGYSKINRSDVNLETYSGTGVRGTTSRPDTMVVQLRPGNLPVITPTLNYADGSVLKLADPQGWGPTNIPGGGMFGYLKYFKARDELGQVRLSTDHELKRFFHDVELGVSFTDRYKKDGENPSGYLNSPSNTTTMALPAKVGETDMSYLGLGKIYAYDPLLAYDRGVWGFTPNNSTDMISNTFQVREKISQVYAQFNIESKWGNVPVSGNVGARLVSVDQNSKGYSVSGGLLNAVSGGDKYNDVAPALNLDFQLPQDMHLRFAVGRQITRPVMYDMRASQSWSYDPAKAASTDLNQSPWSSSGGNVKLRPWKADSIDLSFEKYFADNKGYVAIAAYNKKLLSYVYTQQTLQDFTGYPVRTGGTPVLHQGIASQPVNGEGGNLKGVEFSLRLPSELVAKDIKGLGLEFNLAYTDSNIKPWGPTGGDAPLTGLAKKVANATLYYESHGFSARLSGRYRSETREYITTFGPPNRAGDSSSGSGYTMARPEKVIDAQISYNFQTGYWKKFTVYLQAYNLGDEPLVTYQDGDARRVINYQKYGASYTFGGSYKF